MSIYAKKLEFIELRLTSGGTIQPLTSSVQNAQLKIERRSERLEKIVFHVRFDLAGITATAARDKLEGFFKDVRLKLNDAAGNDRLAIKANSSTLINRHRFLMGDLDRYTKRYYGTNANGTGIEFFVPIYFRHPLFSETVGHRTSLALDSRFQGSDPTLEVDIASLADVGLSAGTFSNITVRAAMHYRIVDPAVAYIPTQFTSNEIWGTGFSGEQSWTFPEDGHLAGFMIEEFTSSTARGAALSTSGTFGEYQFLYNNTERQSWYTRMLEADNECWVTNAPDAGSPPAYNPSFSTDIDFLHDTEQGEALSPGSTYDMYVANSGQRARLYTNNLVNGASVKVSTYKFLTTNLQALVGA